MIPTNEDDPAFDCVCPYFSHRFVRLVNNRRKLSSETVPSCLRERAGTERLNGTCALLDGVEVAVGAAEVDDSIGDERGGKNCADAELALSRDGRRFPPA